MRTRSTPKRQSGNLKRGPYVRRLYQIYKDPVGLEGGGREGFNV